MTEQQLIKGCVRQEHVAQKSVFDLYSKRMMGVCLRYARNEVDAEEILIEAFCKVFEKIHQFKHEGSFEGWIRKIVVNVALKKYSLIRFTYEKSFNYEANYEENYFQEEDSLSDLGEKEILQLINKLPDGYRLVFNLYVIEGYKHDEIAELLKINSGTSRSQLAKARNMLQKQILEMNKEVIR